MLVLIVILVFLQNFRATLVPATTVPVTIIGAFAGMAALGYTVNLSTLFALILAIGIVVDDAIVIVEGVSKYIEQGMSGHDAAIKAMDELFGPIIGITLVLMAVFLPSAFVPGLSGQMFAQFALVIAVTALISAVNAATLKPTQCALWLRPPVPPEQRNLFYRGFNRVYDKAENAYARLIGRMVRRSGIMVVIGLVLAGRRRLGDRAAADRLHPERGSGIPDARGADAGRGRARAHDRRARPGDKDGARHAGRRKVIAISGLSALDNFADLANAGVSFVVLKPWDERSKASRHRHSVDRRASAERRSTRRPTAGFSWFRRRRSRASAMPAGCRCSSSCSAAASITQSCTRSPSRFIKRAQADPQLQRVLTTFSPGAPHVSVTVDRARAQTLRVSVGDVFSDAVVLSRIDLRQSVQQVRSDAPGLYAGRVAVPPAARRSAESLRPQPATTRWSRSARSPSWARRSGRRSSRSTIFIPPRRSSARRPAATARARRSPRWRRSRRATLPADVGYQWTAMSYQEKLTGNQLYYLFGLSVLLVYLCLAGQYESWILPLAVLSAVPLALLGPVVALTSLGVANNLYTQIGLILMIALSAKNGILIVEMAREGRIVHGKSILEAAVEASRLRFRPILMTSFAFGLGVVPLVLATGAGAVSRISLGLSVLSGIIASTCLAVLFVPSFFAVLQKLDERRVARKRRLSAVPAADAAE